MGNDRVKKATGFWTVILAISIFCRVQSNEAESRQEEIAQEIEETNNRISEYTYYDPEETICFDKEIIELLGLTNEEFINELQSLGVNESGILYYREIYESDTSDQIFMTMDGVCIVSWETYFEDYISDYKKELSKLTDGNYCTVSDDFTVASIYMGGDVLIADAEQYACGMAGRLAMRQLSEFEIDDDTDNEDAVTTDDEEVVDAANWSAEVHVYNLDSGEEICCVTAGAAANDEIEDETAESEDESEGIDAISDKTEEE